ncbi:MAG: chorismate lyase [Steroidobacteraceae bacterium]
MPAELPLTAQNMTSWIDAETLAHADVSATIRSWLTYSGLLSARMRDFFGSAYALNIVRELQSIDCTEGLARMACPNGAALLREIEIMNGPRRAMFAQTCIPIMTLQSQPWLGQLGTSSLGETLARVATVHRGPLEFKHLTGGDALLVAATAGTTSPSSLWARRSIFAIEGAPLLVTEVFLPELDRWPPC